VENRDSRYLTGLRPYLLLTVLCLALYLPGIAALPPVDRDEARFMQATRQMLETGDFVRIRFQDEPRHKKPAGIHWLQAGSVALLGDAERGRAWPYRLPSVLGATAAVWLTFLAGKILMSARAALLAAGLLAASLLLVSVAHMATTDAVLLLTVVGAQAALARIYTSAAEGRDAGLPVALAFWATIGAGTLIKGPLAPMVAGLTIGALKLADRETRWLGRLRPFIGLPLAAAIVLPWLWAVNSATEGAFLRDALGQDLLPKLVSGQEAHGFPPGYFLLLMTMTFWPGSILVWPALGHAWRHRADRSVRFCLAWLVPSWLVFELVPTKLPHYVLPLYPALALLTAAAILAAERGLVPRLGRWDGRLTFVIWAGLGLGLAAAITALPLALDHRFSPASLVVLAAAVGVSGYGAAAAWRGRFLRPAAVALLGAVPLFAATFQLVLPATDGLWLSRSAARMVHRALPADAAAPGPEVSASGYHEPSLVFLLGTETKLLGPEAAGALLADDPAALALVARDDNAAFKAELTARGGRAEAVDSATGFNYSKGRWITLTLYAGAGPRKP